MNESTFNYLYDLPNDSIEGISKDPLVSEEMREAAAEMLKARRRVMEKTNQTLQKEGE